MNPPTIRVLDHGHITLKDHMGSDRTVAEAAWVSTNQGSDEPHRVGRLISYLARNNHWTPFGHCHITLHIKMPIFVARQWMRSTVGIVYNEVSRRYIDTPPQFYTPTHFRARPDKSIKQGSGAPLALPVDPLTKVYRDCAFEYQRLLSEGVAPEMARMVLPASTYTEFWMTGSLAAYARVANLRVDSHAQWEVQQYALGVARIVGDLYPLSWKALTLPPI